MIYKTKMNFKNWGSCESAHKERTNLNKGDILLSRSSKHNGMQQFLHLRSNKMFCIRPERIKDLLDKVK